MKDDKDDDRMYVTRACDEGKDRMPTMGIFDGLALVWMIIADLVLGIGFRRDERARRREADRLKRKK